MSFYQRVISPILDKLDSERMHVFAREALHLSELTPLTLRLTEKFNFKGKRFSDDRLKTEFAGIKLENPVMIGAGWDKKGRAVKGLYALGFSAIEVGTVPPKPQPGNSKPRQFMLSKGVSLNRLGFNSPGADVVYRNLRRYQNSGIPIGISLGKNKKTDDKKAPQDHAIVATKLYEFATYFTINVSSPNTPGLRNLQSKKPLTAIVKAVQKAMDETGKRKPLFVKIAPELTNSAIDDVIEVVKDNNLTGIICCNTITDPYLKAWYGEKWKNEAGGLAGDDPDFRRIVNQKIAYIRKKGGKKIVIIGVGGVKDTRTALEKILAGANAVQVFTAIRGEGTVVAGKINRGLVEWMENNDVKSIKQLVGRDVEKFL